MAAPPTAPPLWRALRDAAGARARWARLAAWDTLHNRRWAHADERFLVVRHAGRNPHFYDVLLDWLALYFPEERARFELHPLPPLPRAWSRYRAHLPWLQDPVQAWSRPVYDQAMRVARACAARGIPVVNPVDKLTNAAKSEAARRIAGAGLRTPRMALIADGDAFRATGSGLALPLFVREDWGHGGLMVRVDTVAQRRALDLSGFARPVAVEIVEVRSGDGLFRKYRYVVAGDVGVPQSLHVGRDWCVRGGETVFSEALRDEEVAYTRAPFAAHDRFVAAREALGLDFVAFDFSVDPQGAIVVWEANPYPFVHFIGGRRRYRQWPTSRVLAAMTRLYLTRGGLPVPSALEDVIAREA